MLLMGSQRPYSKSKTPALADKTWHDPAPAYLCNLISNHFLKHTRPSCSEASAHAGQ